MHPTLPGWQWVLLCSGLYRLANSLGRKLVMQLKAGTKVSRSCAGRTLQLKQQRMEWKGSF